MSMEAKIVQVTWIDASHQTGPLDKSQIQVGLLLSTAGWLVIESEDSISIAQDYCADDDDWRHVTTIPKSYVVNMRQVKVGEMNRKRK